VLSTWIAAQPGAFFDIGANTGFYALLAACAGAQQVRAFEPVPAIADLLSANLALNGVQAASTIALHRLALSDQSGEASLFLPDQGHGLIETSASLNPEFRAVHSGALTVPLCRLDNHLADQPLADGLALVIKIDVESWEPQVLRGASRTVDRHRPAIFVEILPPNRVVPVDGITPSLQHRDHLLLPREHSLPLSSGL
jgi:FkbM family methyltransferase